MRNAIFLQVVVGSVILMSVVGVAMQAGSDATSAMAALQRGGCVVVMRHASAPAQPPTKAQADPENSALERQLDARGRAQAEGLGAALQRLKISVSDVWSSPTFRARETVQLAHLGLPRVDNHLGDAGQSMQGATEDQAAWLRARTAELPQAGNVFIVTHQPNIARAFPDVAEVSDGECLVFSPDGRGGATLVGRIKIDDWPALVR
jgi:phosphohistidine phosphatase SixA